MWNLNPKIISFDIVRMQKEKETLALKGLDKGVLESLHRFLSFSAYHLHLGKNLIFHSHVICISDEFLGKASLDGNFKLIRNF